MDHGSRGWNRGNEREKVELRGWSIPTDKEVTQATCRHETETYIRELWENCFLSPWEPLCYSLPLTFDWLFCPWICLEAQLPQLTRTFHSLHLWGKKQIKSSVFTPQRRNPELPLRPGDALYPPFYLHPTPEQLRLAGRIFRNFDVITLLFSLQNYPK